jgi:predicted transcriptional regulator
VILPCEVVVKAVIPAVRSAIARELTETYGFKQTEVAELLGVTQTAVSKYTSHCRGAIFEAIEVEGVQPILKETIFLLSKGEIDKYELAEKLCTICGLIRNSGLMCILCKVSDPNIDSTKCRLCYPHGNSDENKKQKEQ